MALRYVPPELLAESFESDYRRSTDQRGAARRPLLRPIRFWVAGEETPREAALRNLSVDGAFVEHEPLPLNTLLRIELRGAGDEVELREAEVVWAEQAERITNVRFVRGFGVRFLATKTVG